MRAMRHSGLEYLGEIPANWSLDKFGSLFSERNNKVSDEEFAPLSVTKGGVMPQLSHVAKSDDHANRKLVRKGDFAINSRSDRRNSCGFAPQDGSVSLINTICIPRKELETRYYGFLFDSSQWADEFYAWGHGIVADLWTTGWNDMKKIFLPVPPLAEQRRIACFLDAKCAEIDCAVTSANQSIDELKAYKKRLIEETVFNVPSNSAMKPYFECLENLPEHWNIEKLKVHASFFKGNQVTKAELSSTGKRIINYGQIHSKLNTGTHITEELFRYVPEDLVSSHSKLQENDIVLATTSEDMESLGAAIFIDQDFEIYPGSDSMVCRLNSIACPKYVAYQFLTDTWRNQLRIITNGIKVFHVTQERIKKTNIVIPSASEQFEITNFLDKKCKEIESAINSKKAIIDDLKAYKKSLIFEVVTGKVEV